MRVLRIFILSIYVSQQIAFGKDAGHIQIQMPLVETQKSDQYMCYVKLIDEVDEASLETVTVYEDKEVVHHTSTGLCEQPLSAEKAWDCGLTRGQMCKGAAVNLSGVKTKVFHTPENVMLPFGNKTKLRYFILEIHYKDPVKNPKTSAATVTLTFTNRRHEKLYQAYVLLSAGYIPSRMGNGFFSEIACPWSRPPVQAYGYYIHTHHYGYMVEGFLVRNGTWTLIGSQLTKGKTKDVFNIPGGPMLIQPGDVLAARCLFINKGSDPVNFGLSDTDEMCNFQLGIAYDPKDADSFFRPPACTTTSPEFSFCKINELSGLCQ